MNNETLGAGMCGFQQNAGEAVIKRRWELVFTTYLNDASECYLQISGRNCNVPFDQLRIFPIDELQWHYLQENRESGAAGFMVFVPLTLPLSLICSRVPCKAERSRHRQSVVAERRKLNSYETSISTVQDAPETAARIS